MAYLYKDVTSNTPCEILGFNPKIHSITTVKVKTTDQMKEMIHMAVSGGYQRREKEPTLSIEKYDCCVGGYDLHYVSRILIAPVGSMITWVRNRTVLDETTQKYYQKPSDTIFLYRDDSKLICGLMDVDGVYNMYNFISYPDSKEKFNLAVAIAKTTFGGESDKELCKLCHEFDELYTLFNCGHKYREKFFHNIRMIMYRIPEESEIHDLWKNVKLDFEAIAK